MQLESETLKVSCVSLSPIRMQWEPEIIRLVTYSKKPPHVPYRVQAKEKLHRSPQGEIALPRDLPLWSLDDAARMVRLGGRQISTFEQFSSNPIFEVHEDFLPLYQPRSRRQLTTEDMRVDVEHCSWKLDPLEKWESKFTCVYPFFKRWAFDMTLTVHYGRRPGLKRQHIYKLFEISGKRGISSGFGFIPANWPYGKFQVRDIQVVAPS